ncbi:phosphatase PAP2 family protein [Paenibacillus agricola]|nr:phosphatase PAP2 family protein [Paenibacillus agricola]
MPICVSRIYLGVHLPSDVLGGYLASGYWLASSIWYFQR